MRSAAHSAPLRPELAAVFRCLSGRCPEPSVSRPQAKGVLRQLEREGRPQ